MRTCLLAALISALLPAQPYDPAGLRIEVLVGDYAIHNIRAKRFTEAEVRVVDSDGSGVGGAAVTFLPPEFGPGATFGVSGPLTVLTDGEGRAVARGLRPNSQPGQWELRVVASHEGRRARAVLVQTNAAPVEALAPPPRKRTARAFLLAGVAAAVGLTVALAGAQERAPAPAATPPRPGPTPTTITAGSASFGRP